MRLAAVHGLKVSTFTLFLFPREGRHLWNRDLDRLAGERLVDHLAARTGTDPVVAKRTLLKEFEGRLFARFVPNSHNRWIIPLAYRAFVRRGHGVQFCPECLRESLHFRRQWRLSLITLCENHKRVLLSACPKCEAALNFHRREFGHRERTNNGHMGLCHACDHDLTQGSGPAAEASSLELQRDLRCAIERGALDDGRPSVGYFAVLAQVLKLLLSRRCRLKPWQEAARAQAGLPGFTSKIAEGPAGFRPASFDSLAEPSDRLRLLCTAQFLLAEWPTRFVTLALNHGLCATDLTRDFPNPPAWFIDAVRAEFPVPTYAPKSRSDRDKREAAMREFIRNHRREWYRPRQLAERLKKEGFYAPSVHFSQIVPVCERHIQTIRAEHRSRRSGMARQLSPDSAEWKQLKRLAAGVRKVPACSPQRLRKTLLRLCDGRFLSAQELGELLGRDPRVLRRDHIRPLMAATLLEALHPHRLNHNRQAYQTKPVIKSPGQLVDDSRPRIAEPRSEFQNDSAEVRTHGFQ